jgi:hypothetical protein
MALTKDDLSFADEQRAQTLGPYLRWILALASFGAAGLHFAFAPMHFDEWWAEGTFFVVLAWLQLAWGLALLLRPSRTLLYAGLFNVLVIALWIVSRSAGVPFGPNSGTAEPVTFPDTLATVFEAIVVLGSGALLWRPSIARRELRGHSLVPGLAVATSVVLVAVTAISLTPRYTSGHSHGDGGHAHGDEMAAGGHSHGEASAASTGGGHPAGHADVAATPFAPGESPCEQEGPAASKGQLQGESAEGSHGHRGWQQQKVLTEAERLLLQQQQQQAREVVARYPTVADALKGGYIQSTPFVPCIGAHYTNARLAIRFDPGAPSELLFDGTTPDSKIVGLSYLVWSPTGPPEGFAGENDFWHTHSFNGGLCMKGALVIGNEDTSKKDCEARGGRKAALEDIYMVHDWVVPGWDCSWGVFAGECPELGGRIGRRAFD